VQTTGGGGYFFSTYLSHVKMVGGSFFESAIVLQEDGETADLHQLQSELASQSLWSLIGSQSGSANLIIYFMLLHWKIDGACLRRVSAI